LLHTRRDAVLAGRGVCVPGEQLSPVVLGGAGRGVCVPGEQLSPVVLGGACVYLVSS
jgi:hypothetical protein